jgi:hypothetical protein
MGDLKQPPRREPEERGALRKDLFAMRTRLYDKIKIPLRALDLIIFGLVAALVVALILGVTVHR